MLIGNLWASDLQVQKGSGAWLLPMAATCPPTLSPHPFPPPSGIHCLCSLVPGELGLPTCISFLPPGLGKAPAGSHRHWVGGSCLLTRARQGGRGEGTKSQPQHEVALLKARERRTCLGTRTASAATLHQASESLSAPKPGPPRLSPTPVMGKARLPTSRPASVMSQNLYKLPQATLETSSQGAGWLCLSSAPGKRPDPTEPCPCGG